MVKKAFGLIVVITGCLLLLANFDVVEFNDVSGVVFSLGIMTIGILGVAQKRRFDLILSSMIILGGLYFLTNIGVFEEEIIELVFWPFVIIAVGLSLLFSVTRKIVSNKPVTSYVAVFSGVEDKNVSSEYISSEITAVFGGADIDYRKINIKDKVGYIDITVAFGGVTIIVPEDIKVTVKGLPIFGGAENKSVSNKDSKKELIINYTAVFGGVEIKN